MPDRPWPPRAPLAALVLTACLALVAGPRACAQPATVEAETGTIDVATIASGLVHPWSLAFLPDGRMLVTERPGRLRIVTPGREVGAPLGGVPDVAARGQGGLLGVALDPDFADNGLVYLSFAEPGRGGASTAVARGRLAGDRLEGTEVIFRQQPKVGGGRHFGGRLVFAPDGTLFVTMGDRGVQDPAQDLSDHIGTIARINPDGTIPGDNPFVGREGALPETWSYGHRNVQGAVIHPETGVLWTHEMGPRGGDELNVPEAGRNHGWPVVSWGREYSGRAIPDPPTHPEFADAVRYWDPVISPSGMAYYTGGAFPAWQGSLLLGGLSSEGLIRLELDGRTVTREERIAFGVRLRDVVQGPDGAVYVLTDQPDGEILRLTPQ